MIRKNTILNLILLILLSMLTLSNPVFSHELRIESRDIGFKIIPQYQEFMNVSGISPGDSVDGNFTIANNFTGDIQVYLRVERTDRKPIEGGPDLYEQLEMLIDLNGEAIYDGNMIGFAADDGISLGTLKPGEKHELDILMHLPGRKTDNGFMGLAQGSRWIITALDHRGTLPVEDPGRPSIDDEKIPIEGSRLPKTGTMSYGTFYLLGLTMILLGVGLFRNKINS